MSQKRDMGHPDGGAMFVMQMNYNEFEVMYGFECAGADTD
jgi:hypothetical protein